MSYLWEHRERPSFASKRWVVVWGKRVLLFPALLRLGLIRLRHEFGGMHIGRLSILCGVQVNGAPSRVHVGDSTFIGSRVRIAAHDQVQIGSNVCINDDVLILTASHDVADPQWRTFTKPVTIKDHAWIATGATLMPGVTVGRGAVVGARTVVTRDIPDHAVASGNPARLVLDRRSKSLAYDPVIFSAPYEAWVGRNAALKREGPESYGADPAEVKKTEP